MSWRNAHGEAWSVLVLVGISGKKRMQNDETTNMHVHMLLLEHRCMCGLLFGYYRDVNIQDDATN